MRNNVKKFELIMGVYIMGPVQGSEQQGTGAETKRRMTLDEVVATLEQQGIEVEGLPEPAAELSMDQKIGAMIESLGGMPQQGGEELSEEQRLILENQYRQDLKMKILETEKEIRMKHPDASEAQLWDAAHAFLRGDVIGVSDIFGKMYQTAAEKEKQQTAKDMDLHIEGDSGGGDRTREAPVGLGDIFSPGGTLDASFASRS